jgi:phage tail tape-measure protein
VIVHIEGSGAEIRLRAVNDSGWVVGDTLSINVGRAWELLAPATLLPPWISRLAGPASLAGSAVVVALLCAAAWPTLVALSVTVVTMALGVAIIPMALGIHSIGGADVVGVAIGVLAGMQLGGWTRRGTRSR